MEAQTFQDKLAGMSPQGRGDQGGEGGREGGGRITTPDPRDPSADNKLAAKGLWLHVFL